MSELYASNSAAQVGIRVTLSTLLVTDLIGNTLVILIILTNNSMKSPMNYLLVNLAVADMMVGVFFAPLFIFIDLFAHPEGIAGTILCRILTGGNLAWIGAAASTLSLMIICIERYYSIVHPFSTKYKLSMVKTKRLIAVCWIIAVVATTPYFFCIFYDKEMQSCTEKWSKQQKWLAGASSTLWFFLSGILPITTMFVLYSRVIYTLWFKRSEHRAQGTQLAMLKSRKRVTKMMIIVSVIYCVCWSPLLITHLLFSYGIQLFSINTSFVLKLVLMSFNSAINPFIYTLQGKKFRHHLMEIICCRKLRCRKRNSKSNKSKSLDKDHRK